MCSLQVGHGWEVQFGPIKVKCHLHPGTLTCNECEPGLVLHPLKLGVCVCVCVCKVKTTQLVDCYIYLALNTLENNVHTPLSFTVGKDATQIKSGFQTITQ